MRFVVAGSASDEPTEHYDAVLCMAVLRHGDLGYRPSASCAHRIKFEAFDNTVRELSRCVKIGAYLIIEHSNFRFCDSSSASQFVVVGTRDAPVAPRPTPMFGRDNMRLEDQIYREVIFRKVSSLSARVDSVESPLTRPSSIATDLREIT
jgi:hypothetical protein